MGRARLDTAGLLVEGGRVGLGEWQGVKPGHIGLDAGEAAVEVGGEVGDELADGGGCRGHGLLGV
jgi:hypothetical protein